MTEELDPFLDERELATELRVARITLQAWRRRKHGPPFVRVGRRIRYQRSAVDAWLRSRTIATSDGADK